MLTRHEKCLGTPLVFFLITDKKHHTGGRGLIINVLPKFFWHTNVPQKSGLKIAEMRYPI